MKKFIKEVARLEGKRSQASIGNLRETVKVAMAVLMADLIVDGDKDGGLFTEWHAQEGRVYEKGRKKLEKKPDMTYEELVQYLLK